jgi:hypothetical protein
MNLPDKSRMNGRIALGRRPPGDLHPRTPHALHQIGSKEIEAEEDKE